MRTGFLFALLLFAYAGCSTRPAEKASDQYLSAMDKVNRFQVAATDSAFLDQIRTEDSAAWQMYAGAIKDERQMQYLDALNLYMSINEKYEDFSPAYLAVARVYDHLGFPWLAVRAAEAYAKRTGNGREAQFELARYYLSTGQYDKARKAAGEAAEAGYQAPADAAMQAEAFFMLNDPKAADEAYGRAISSDRADPRFYRAAADYMEARGMIDSAINLSQMAVFADGYALADAQTHFFRCLRNKYFYDARIIMDTIAGRDTSTVLKATMAYRYEKAKGNVTIAAVDLRRYRTAAMQYPLSGDLNQLIFSAEVHNEMSAQEAIDHLTDIMNGGQISRPFRTFLEYRVIYGYIDINRGLKAVSLLDSLSGEFAKGDINKLLRLVLASGSRNDTLYDDMRSELLDDHKKDPAFLTRIGDALMHPAVNSRDSAAEFYQMALETSQDYRRAFERLILLYMAGKEYKRALGIFRTYEQFAEQSPLMGLRRAICLADAGDIDNAATLFTNYAPEVSGNLVLLNQFLSQLYRQYAVEEVLRFSDEVADLSPDDPDVLVLAANWLAEYGKYDKVADLASKALKIEPGNPDAATLTAWASFNSGKKQSALKQLDSLLKANSENPETNMYYSRALMAVGKDMPYAGNYARMAAGSRLLGMRAVANLWDYYMQQDQYNFAVGTARQAVAGFPDYPLAHYLLGKSLIAYDRQEEGRAELKKAIELGLGGEDLNDARKLLGKQ